MFFALILAIEISGFGTTPPDVKGFTVVLSKELEFRIDDYKTAFVGRVVDYQNPNDPNEFVRVYYRQVAIISERAQEKNAAGVGGRDRNSSDLNYHRKQETEALGRVQQATDSFAYVKWRTIRDLRTGQEIRTGLLQSWLLEQNGNWTFSSSHNILTAPFSELSSVNIHKRIIVGIQFTLAGGSHLVRIDQDDILISEKGTVDDHQ